MIFFFFGWSKLAQQRLLLPFHSSLSNQDLQMVMLPPIGRDRSHFGPMCLLVWFGLWSMPCLAALPLFWMFLCVTLRLLSVADTSQQPERGWGGWRSMGQPYHFVLAHIPLRPRHCVSIFFFTVPQRISKCMWTNYYPMWSRKASFFLFFFFKYSN